MDITGPRFLATKANKHMKELIDYMYLVEKVQPEIVFYLTNLVVAIYN